MEVRIFPNSRRPGAGLAPKREASRPLLPQHARHCPVLEAGSALGFMVYAPLEPKESLFVEFEGDGRYRFVLLPAHVRRQAHADLSGHDEPLGGRHRHDEGRGDVRGRAHAVARGGAGSDAGIPRPGGYGHSVRRGGAARRDQFPDAVRLGHRVLANPQHDRAPGGADAGDSRRDRLVHARDRVSLRAAGGGGHHRRAKHPDRAGLLRAARGDHHARVHE